MCGDRVGSAEECKEAATELLWPNNTVTVLDHKQAPAGCFVDQTRAYFNHQAQAGSHYSFLKSLCRLKNISAMGLPEAKTESIHACGRNWTLPVYRITAEDLQRVIDKLRSHNVQQYALLLNQGNARIQKTLEIVQNGTQGLLDIVIAGQLPQGWAEMTQPPTAAQLTTRVDLAWHSIFISGGAGSVVCLQDLHLSNGRVWPMGAILVCKQEFA